MRTPAPRSRKTKEKPAPARSPGRPAAATDRRRKAGSAARRHAILDAALLEFSEFGYQAARLDKIAERAGIAKGTIYLYFTDKETLFEEVILGAISPVLQHLDALSGKPDLPIDQMLDMLFAVFEREVLGTSRKLLLRLVIADGPRFPRIAEFYYRNVVGRVLPLISGLAERAAARRKLHSDALARFPQLAAAPLLFIVIWDALFARTHPLDVPGFLDAYRDMLIGKTRSHRP